MKYYNDNKYGIRLITQDEFDKLDDPRKIFFGVVYYYAPIKIFPFIKITVYASQFGPRVDTFKAWGERVEVQKRMLGWGKSDIWKVDANKLSER